MWETAQETIVITGLDPVIHALLRTSDSVSGNGWPTGPAMTASGSLEYIWCSKVAFKFELEDRWSTPNIRRSVIDETNDHILA
jgi:hypothetical protein